MNQRNVNTTATVAEAIVRSERAPLRRNEISLSGPEQDRAAEVRDHLNDIAAHLGLDKSFLTGGEPTELIDLFHETRVKSA